MKVVDLRSDTVTLPTREMIESIQTAPLGDDARGREDPTVRKLEELSAEKTGKEDALLVPSGTMGNLVSILAHTERGNEVIVERTAHVMNNEFGSWIIIGGLIPSTVVGKLGYMDPHDVDVAVRPKGQLKTGLICMENTHNNAGGIVITPEQMKAIWDVAKKHELPVHTDGARIFNAAVYLGVDVKNLIKYTDSITFCFSKGLSAPVGSVVCGTKEFIARARNFRKLVGGAMREAGIIAAPGIVALTKMIDRLKEDHETAAMLAEGLRGIKGIKILHPVQTNIVHFDVGGLGLTGDQFMNEMKKFNIRTGGGARSSLRVVTHRHITKDDIKYTIECISKITAK
jgi:threonine aldolase